MNMKFTRRGIRFLAAKGCFNFLSDEKYLKLKYWACIGKRLDLNNPKTFNEKLQWLKLYDRSELYTKLVDKYDVREYIKSKIGEEYLVPLYGVWNSFEEIDFDELPDQFVLKCTHDSGGVVICKNKKFFNRKNAKDKLKKHLSHNFYYLGREWPYKNIKPRIIAEPYLEDKKYGELRDYKFYMFNGELALSFVCSDRANSVKYTFFDKNKKFLDIKQCDCPNDPTVELPQEYELMVDLARKLSKDFIHVRVDFYEINNKVFFGELTFYDASGFGYFEPEEWDKKIGDMLKLPKLEKENNYEK